MANVYESKPMKWVKKVGEKVVSNKGIQAISSGMMMVMGVILLGAVFQLLAVSISGVLKGDYFITFLTPKGSKGAYIELLSKYPKQRELLFDKNLKYRILEICNNEITLEVIT